MREAAQTLKDRMDGEGAKVEPSRVLTKIFVHNCKITINSMMNQIIKALDSFARE